MIRQREEEQRRKLDGRISINENEKDAKEKRAGDRMEFHGHLYKLIMELIWWTRDNNNKNNELKHEDKKEKVGERIYKKRVR